jgi:hypothetical protein
VKEPHTEWVRANLSAGPLGSYAFRVEAKLGHRPMTYLFGRSIGLADGMQQAVTVLLVIAPATLAGTRVTITERFGQEPPVVTTFLPTMREPKPIIGAYLFECLPLTDVGYLDMMAWLHPPAHDAPLDPALRWSSWHQEPRVSVRRSTGSDGFEVVETVSATHGVPVARSITLNGIETRRWEAGKLGDASHGYLPLSIRVSRPQTGHWTVFERSTEPRVISPEWLGADFESLRDAILRELGRV